MNENHPIVEERLERVQSWMREGGYSASSVVTTLSQLRFLLKGWTDLEDPGTIIANFTAAPFTRQPSLLSAWRSMEKACAPPNDLYLPTIPEFEARAATGRPRLAGGDRPAADATKREQEPELVSALGKTKSDLLRAAWALHNSLPFIKEGKTVPIGALSRLTWNMIRPSTPRELVEAQRWIRHNRTSDQPMEKTLVFYTSEAGDGIEAVVLTTAWLPIFQILAGWCGTENVNKGGGAFLFPALPDTAGPPLKVAELRKAITAPELAVQHAATGERILAIGEKWRGDAPDPDSEQAQMRKTVGALSALKISSDVFAPVIQSRPTRPTPTPREALGPSPSTIIQAPENSGSPTEDT